ncbi:hypothetical protein [Myxacorys almedinensis]|uniref:Uncharacterized protein n=1 Tax=Myxacorys almedinensis A TaxID=2690445 RepID=A0A8J7Z1A1_9CYAN|nr:hypothetical protein [Myxacorys almedinensis]NDJ17829.1 hypothetical protein [Myxacorys almedinensis A]
MKEQFFKWLNLALMLDVFFVLFCFAWLAIALIGHTTNLPLGLNLWYKLWEPVMQPALVILMAGALLSGISSWVAKRFSSDA